MRGIDVSHYNGEPFNAITQKAYNESDFIIAKATQGTSYKWASYGTRVISRALTDNKLVGAYHYASGQDAIKEADYFIATVKQYIGRIILALDWEQNGNRAWGSTTWCGEFIARVKEVTGVTCFLYTGTQGIVQNKVLSEAVPLWFAGYPDNADTWLVPDFPKRYNISPWSKYTIWQYTSSWDTIDRNTTSMNKDTWQAYCKKQDTPTVKEEKTVAVKVGSARIDENGRATGGKAGDQTGKEVATENWYLHKLGWVVIRAKTATMREKIAQNMQWACDNPHIGYDQWQNQTLWNVAKPLGFNCSKVKTNCETDCARLTRVCVWYAGSKPVDYYTATEVQALKATGDFEILTTDKYCKSSDYLLRGDILVTKTKGHTVVVLSNGAKVQTTTSTNTTTQTKPTTGTTSNTTSTTTLKANIKEGQKWLNEYYGTTIKKYLGATLSVDGVFGPKTREACVCVWKDLCNRKYKTKLTPNNANFKDTSKKAAAKVTVKYGDKGTFPVLAKILLASRGLDAGSPTSNLFTRASESATKEFQKKFKLTQTGTVNADTWYKLFN